MSHSSIPHRESSIYQGAFMQTFHGGPPPRQPYARSEVKGPYAPCQLEGNHIFRLCPYYDGHVRAMCRACQINASMYIHVLYMRNLSGVTVRRVNVSDLHDTDSQRMSPHNMVQSISESKTIPHKHSSSSLAAMGLSVDVAPHFVLLFSKRF